MKRGFLGSFFFILLLIDSFYAQANVFGVDSRSHLYPNASALFHVLKVSVSGGEKCSGVLIGPHLVLTAAHCVLPALHQPQVTTSLRLAPQKPIRDLSVLYGYYSNHAEKVSQVKKVYVGLADMNHYDKDFPRDFAILVLNQALGKQFAYLKIDFSAASHSLLARNLTMSAYDFYEWAADSRGHPVAVTNQSMSEGCSFRKALANNVYFHDCPSERGASGAPLMQCRSPQDCTLLALHIGEQRNGGNFSLRLPEYSDDFPNYAIGLDQVSSVLSLMGMK